MINSIPPTIRGRGLIRVHRRRAIKEYREKRNIEDIIKWEIEELAFLIETKECNPLAKIEEKKKWILSLVPESSVDEIILKAEKLANEYKIKRKEEK